MVNKKQLKEGMYFDFDNDRDCVNNQHDKQISCRVWLDEKDLFIIFFNGKIVHSCKTYKSLEFRLNKLIEKYSLDLVTGEIEENKDNENEKELTSKELVSKHSSKTLLYCFKNEKGAVFLNRWDERIKQFETMHEALEFAKNNINLVDVKINKK